MSTDMFYRKDWYKNQNPCMKSVYFVLEIGTLRGEDVVVVKDLHMSSVIENMYLTMFVLSAWSMKRNN